jgi:hypothetical protein
MPLRLAVSRPSPFFRVMPHPCTITALAIPFVPPQQPLLSFSNAWVHPLIPRPFVLLHLFKHFLYFSKSFVSLGWSIIFCFFILHSFQLFPTTTIMHFSATQAFAFAHFMAAALAAPAIPILDLLVAAEILQTAAIQEFSAGAGSTGLSPICPSLNTSDHGCIRCRTHLFTAIRIYVNT